MSRFRKNYLPVLTIRLTDEETRILTQRSRRAGMKKATLVRQLIREQPYVTVADVLTDMEKFHGDERLRIRRK